MDTTLLPNVVCTETHTNRLVRIDRVLPNGFFDCNDVFLNKQLTIHRTLLLPMPTIPSKYKQHQFAQVAEHIASALRSWPIAVRINPTPLSVDTLARKLREAIEAKKLYGWRYPTLDEKLWDSWSELLVAGIDQDSKTGASILLGSRDAIKSRKVKSVGVTAGERQKQEIELVSPTVEDLEYICLILHSKKLKPVPVVSVRGLTQATVDSLELRYDVAIIPLESDPTLFQIIA